MVEDFPNAIPDNFIWMTYDQIHTFMRFSNYVNIQARSLLSAVRASDEKTINIVILGLADIAQRFIIPTLLGMPEYFSIKAIIFQRVEELIIFLKKR